MDTAYEEMPYRAIFEATGDVVLIVDPQDFHIVEVNPAACRAYGYSHEEFVRLHVTALVHPDRLSFVETTVLPLIAAGGQYHARGLGLRKDSTTFYVEAHTTPFTYKGKPHTLGVVRDITEQVQAQRLLEQRVEERTRELSTLLEVSHNVASTLELKSLLGLILDQLKVVAEYTGASILTVEGQELVIVANRGPNPVEQVRQLRFPLERMGLLWEVLCRRELVMIDNVRDATPWPRPIGSWLATSWKRSSATHVHC